MEATEQEAKQSEEQWDSLKLDKTEEECKGKSLLNWRMETRSTLAKAKANLIEEIKAMVKIPESMQNVLDAYLTALGYKTTKARKQAMNEFKERKLDLLKAAKTIKPADLTYNDCSKIQELIAGVEEDKVSKINLVCKDLLKWTSNMVQIRIAEARFPESMKETVSTIKEEKKTSLKRPTTAVTKILINEEVGLVKKDAKVTPAKRSSISKPNKKKKVAEEEKEDWTIFGITQEDPPHDQLVNMLEECVKNLSCINKKDIVEICSLRSPAQTIVDVLGLLGVFFGHKEITNNTEIMKFIKTTGPRLIEMLMNYNKDNIPFTVMKKAKEFFEKYPDVELISKINKATASIYLFMKALYNYRLVSYPITSKRPRVVQIENSEVKNNREETKESNNMTEDIQNKETQKEEEKYQPTEDQVHVPNIDQGPPPTIDQVSPVINSARQALCCVDKNSLTELISLKKAPKTVDIVIKCALHILGSKTESDKNHKWKTYRSSKMLIDDITHLDLNTITDADAEYVNKCINDNKLSIESVKTVSLAASNLYQWVIGVLSYRTIRNEIRRRVGSGWNPEWEALVNGTSLSAEPVEEEKKEEAKSADKTNGATTPSKSSLNSSTKKKKAKMEEDWSTFGVVADNIDRNAIAEVLQKAQSSIQSITTSDITQIKKMRAPPQTVLDVLDAVFRLLGAKEATRAEIPKDLLNRLLTFDISNAKFSDMKYLQKYFESYPDPDKIKKASQVASGLWHWLNSVYRKRLFVEFFGVKGRFKRNPTWESLDFTKSEEEATGERFTQWMTTTQEYIDQIQPQDITEMKCCRILSNNLTKVLKAIGLLFGARTEKQIQRFLAEGWKVASFLTDVRNARIDQLTLEDCFNCQVLLVDLSRDIVMRSNRAGADLYSFITNFIELRIAVALYGDRTGYTISETQAEPEEEKKEVEN